MKDPVIQFLAVCAIGVLLSICISLFWGILS